MMHVFHSTLFTNFVKNCYFYSLPITQCKQKYPSMDVEIRKDVKGWIEGIAEKYG